MTSMSSPTHGWNYTIKVPEPQIYPNTRLVSHLIPVRLGHCLPHPCQQVGESLYIVIKSRRVYIPLSVWIRARVAKFTSLGAMHQSIKWRICQSNLHQTSLMAARPMAAMSGATSCSLHPARPTTAVSAIEIRYSEILCLVRMALCAQMPVLFR